MKTSFSERFGLSCPIMLAPMGGVSGGALAAAVSNAGGLGVVGGGYGDHTQRTRVFDIARGFDWPPPYTGRALRNRFTERWHGRESALQADAGALEGYRQAQQRGEFDVALAWGGESVDLITGVEPAGALTERIGRKAVQLLHRLGAA